MVAHWCLAKTSVLDVKSCCRSNLTQHIHQHLNTGSWCSLSLEHVHLDLATADQDYPTRFAVLEFSPKSDTQTKKICLLTFSYNTDLDTYEAGKLQPLIWDQKFKPMLLVKTAVPLMTIRGSKVSRSQ